MMGFDDALKVLKLGGIVRREKWGEHCSLYLLGNGLTSDDDGLQSRWQHSEQDLMAGDWSLVDVTEKKYLDSQQGNVRSRGARDRWPLSVIRTSIGEGRCLSVGGLTLDDIENAMAAMSAHGRHVEFIVISAADMYNFNRHREQWRDHYEPSAQSAMLLHGYMGRLFGRSVATDAYLPVDMRFVSASCVC